MEALHDQDDRTMLFVVEARHQRIVVELFGLAPSCSEIPWIAFWGSSMMMRSAPRPRMLPPMPLARR